LRMNSTNLIKELMFENKNKIFHIREFKNIINKF
jgi:hypothetical protein